MPVPIYYINLAARPERRDFMERQFEKLGLSAERVDAVTVDAITSADRAAYCDPEKPNFLRPASFACTLSKEKVWRLMQERGDRAALIFEDDVILSAALPSFLATLGDLAFDFIRIETSLRRLRMLPATTTIDGVALRPFRSADGGAAGYLISQGAATAMLNGAATRRMAGDIALTCPFRSPIQPRERVFLTDPGLCVQLGNIGDREAPLAKSSIDPGYAPTHTYLQRHPWQTRGRDAVYRVHKTWDHLAHLPRGITRRSIPFLE